MTGQTAPTPDENSALVAARARASVSARNRRIIRRWDELDGTGRAAAVGYLLVNGDDAALSVFAAGIAGALAGAPTEQPKPSDGITVWDCGNCGTEQAAVRPDDGLCSQCRSFPMMSATEVAAADAEASRLFGGTA